MMSTVEASTVEELFSTPSLEIFVEAESVTPSVALWTVWEVIVIASDQVVTVTQRWRAEEAE